MNFGLVISELRHLPKKEMFTIHFSALFRSFFRISDEIGMLSPALVHKHIDMGEEAFVDRFLALEML